MSAKTPKRAKSKWGEWAHDMECAEATCAHIGMTVEPSTAAYEVAVVRGDGVQVLIYPHTVSSTRNKHLRVRDHGSKNKARADWVMQALNVGHGLPEDKARRIKFSCTFHRKNHHKFIQELGPMP